MTELTNKSSKERSPSVTRLTNYNDKRSIALLIPWSCREGFTNDVCGLPTDETGCWRYRECGSNVDVEEKGIRPRPLSVVEDPLIAWITFESPIDGTAITASCGTRPPSLNDSHHQAIFGFTRKGLDAFRSFTEGEYPNFLQLRGVSNGQQVIIKNWTRDSEHEDLGLSDCFGHHTFVKQFIENTDLRLKVEVSLSDLIRSYLNHNSGCKFRKDEASRGVGITMCKVEVALAKAPVTLQKVGQQPQTLANTSAISFSYVDTETLNLKKLAQWRIGKHDRDIDFDEYYRSLSDKHFVPLRVRRISTGSGEIEVNFATCLSRDGRQNVLPSEVGKSFLSFSLGEIASYLLHWLLLRIFADESHENGLFVELFAEWEMSLRRGDAIHRAHFEQLLRQNVTLRIDTNVFTEAIGELQAKELYLGVFETPVSFGEALGVLGLSNGHSCDWIPSTIEFLTRFFDTSRTKPKFQQLPMYRDLNWHKSSLLLQLSKLSDNVDKIEAAIPCMSSAAGITKAKTRTEFAVEELHKHSRRSVFPIADVLANLPYGEKLPFYYIFPIWEETIRDEAGGDWRGPVIFAHVFTRALQFTPNDLLPDETEILAIGEQLQAALLPAGAAIAHDFYNLERKRIDRSEHLRKIAWTQARAWAHEVKNYTSPIITDLASPILNDENVSEDARVIIVRARRAMLILNAASKAIQLAISRLGSISKMADDKLEELPREHAKEIVEAVLQYLLNYRVETMGQDFVITWQPRYGTNQSITRLSNVLRAMGRKLDGQDVERIVLGDKVIIGVIALLREIISNIRMDSPYEVPGVVNVSYRIEESSDWLILDLMQHQIEDLEGEELPDEPPGVKMANELLGENCARFGSIRFLKTESSPRPDGKGIDVRYSAQIKFALAKGFSQ